MKHVTKALLIGVLALALAACGKDEEDTTVRDLLILAALSRPQSTSLLTPQQQQASTAAGAAASASGAASSANTSGAQSHLAPATIAATVLDNGNDPVVVREIVRQVTKAADKADRKNPVHLAQIMISDSNTDSGGYNVYNVSGSIDGRTSQVVTLDLANYFGAYINGSCPVTFTTFGTGTQGTATLSGTLSYSGSGTGTSFSGSVTYNGSTVFSNYGAFYTDYFTYFTRLKQLQSGQVTPSTNFCTNLQTTYSILGDIYRFATIGGTVTGSTTSTSNYSSSSTSFSGTTSSSSTINSTDFSVDGAALPIENLMYSYSSNFSVSGTSVGSGSMTITMTGKIGGNTLNETLTVTF